MGIFGLLVLTTAALISNYNDIDNWSRLFFNGNLKTKIGGGDPFTIFDNDFPTAFTVLSLIGIIAIILGAIYWLAVSLSKKNNCLFTNYNLPGPITGAFMGLGGILGFIGSMVFIPYGNDFVEGGFYNYAFGYILVTVVFGLFFIIGLLIVLTTKKGRKPKKKKK